ncbi:hypothetical protein INR49_001742 [Caranx melampygus]|nr:hypothetical protein INR49_001742 [Caranx melampygus]
MDEVEKYMMTRLYKEVFCPETTDDEKKDLAIQKRIRALHWVTIEMLCVPVDEEIPVVSDSVVKAITDVIEMDSKRVPKDKLACITRCSKHIFNAIKSNIQYITRFCNPSRLMTGEDGYYFTNLCCAVAFIEKLDAQSLNLSSEEFELYMTGQASPHWPQASGASSCSPGSAALSQVHKRLDLLTGLGERQERVMEKARQLESDLIDWTDEVEQKVQSVLESFPPETQNPPTTTASETPAASSAIDSDNIENELLPPPLQPQVFAGYPQIHLNFLWYKEAEKLPFTGETLSLWNIGVKEDGIYTCKGVRDTAVGNIYTLESLPVQINVDGGWAILRAPHDPALVGDTLKVTCQLRQNFPVTGAILYRDGFEVMSQSSLEFELTDLSLDDNGMYSCRVSWEANGRTLSVISVESEVVVKEVLTKPVMEVVPKDGSQFVTLICRAEYNGKAPILFYFYKNKVQLGTANSGGTDTYRKSPGLYSCKAKVPQLGLTLWSEPTPYEPAADL